MLLDRTNLKSRHTERLAVHTSHDPTVEALAKESGLSTTDVWESLCRGETLESETAKGVRLSYRRAGQ